MVISRFNGQYAFLSNFYRSPIQTSSIVYPTMEHYFQAHKSTSRRFRVQVSEASGPRQAKVLGRRVHLRLDWSEVKLDVMRAGLALKFEEGTELASRLVGTAPMGLIEGNSWGDTFWGAERIEGTWNGKNWLGWLLMAQRSYLMMDF